MITWVNGKPQDSIGLADRGLAYGDGLFETIKVKDGQPVRLALHLQRLEQGCKRLGMAVDIALLTAEILEFCQASNAEVCKLILTRGEGPRGYAVPEQPQIQRILIASSLPNWPAAHAEQGVKLFPCSTRLSIQPRLAGMKHLNRLEQVLARAEWKDPAYAEGLMLDMQERITDCVFSNIFFVRKGILITPTVADCGVAGVTRAYIFQLALELNVECIEAELGLQDLQGMDEVFVCNSLYGIWPVRSFESFSWQPGEITRRLQSMLAD